tara:strand:+ start:154 stop:396 length:243 start_codon:yes stop_codon:yes gene_type:complete
MTNYKDQFYKDINHLDRALDAMCQAANELGESTDWVGTAQLVTLEGMIDDLGERVTELRLIAKVCKEVREKAREEVSKDD